MSDTDLADAPYDPKDDVRDIYEMANLYPRETGLPRTVWVSPRGHARNDVRVKVSSAPGDRMDFEDAPVVGVRPAPRVIHGSIPAFVRDPVIAWIGLNREALIDYWDGRIGTIEFATRLRPVEP